MKIHQNLNPGLRAAIEAAPEMKYGDGPEMGHDSPAEAHCMGPRMEKGSALRKEFSIEEAKKRMEEEKEKKKQKKKLKNKTVRELYKTQVKQ